MLKKEYNPQYIESKWQERWESDRLYHASEDSDKPKWYYLVMFPYPSGPLHVGHWFMYAPPDAKARYLRMKGYNVLFPIGFDAFGLPAENAAIKRAIHPKEWTYNNIEEMRVSFRRMGSSYNWEREIISCDPEYVRWTQWLFLQMYKNGLAYRTFAPVDWCPKCNTTLAREQVIGENRVCERCDTPVVKRELNQWLFRITKYADELLDFSDIDWPERVKIMQTNWIGRSEGADVVFKSEMGDDITVFTTRPDTLWGATFMVLAPEHPLVDKLTTLDRRSEVESYVAQAARESEVDRTATDREKTGVFIGAYAINPVNGERIPIWTADYVLITYGTGAIMAVPAHDERDFEFANKFNLPIRVVIAPPDWDSQPLMEAYTGDGAMVNSGSFDGTLTAGGEAVRKIIVWLEEEKIGTGQVRYRLHDWLISRQRYWGAPIPIIYCNKCGTVPVPEENLPVLLPEDVDFMPTGESPLKYHEGFRQTSCPECNGQAEREIDTMDTFVDSSWYWFRYVNPDYEKGFMDPHRAGYWLPVDQYVGGVEHATLHLLYSRFFTKALHDMGYVDHDEPFLRLFNQGLILGEDGEKMSKSRGNVVDPAEYVSTHGVDVFRTFLMFIGPWSRGGPWSTQGIRGVARFYQRVWDLIMEPSPKVAGVATEDQVAELHRKVHQTIRKVNQDVDRFEFNTAVAALMEFVGYLIGAKETTLTQTDAWTEAIRSLVLLLAPLGPHIAEELWEQLGYEYSVHRQAWPEYDEALAAEETFTLVVQVNGKLRDKLEVPVSITEDEAKELALQSEKVKRHMNDLPPKHVIYSSLDKV